MISIANIRTKDSEMMTTAVATSYRRWRLTRHAIVAEDTAVEVPPVSLGMAVRSDDQI
jgi:hypothetical protein